ncbi:unnamed protein product, partial [Didymodactylos carnosus]
MFRTQPRLYKLIQTRLKPDSDKEKIDKSIWDLFGEEWSIMFTDLSGFSSSVAESGIIHFLQRIYESERLLSPVIEDNDGLLLKVEGDSMLIIFRNVDKAVNCALEMQRKLSPYNKAKADEDKVLLCLGLGYGKVLKIGNENVYGPEVNLASKLGEDTAKAGEILLTQAVKDKISNKDFKFREIDEVFKG